MLSVLDNYIFPFLDKVTGTQDILEQFFVMIFILMYLAFIVMIIAVQKNRVKKFLKRHRGSFVIMIKLLSMPVVIAVATLIGAAIGICSYVKTLTSKWWHY